MTVDELVDAWRANMEDASKDETAREQWLRSQLNTAYADGYARAKEQAAKTCEREAEKQREGAQLLDLDTREGRVARTYCEERERTADFLADDIRAMKDEGNHE